MFQAMTTDEERLLQLFRNCSVKERSKILYRLTKLQFAEQFAADFQGNELPVSLSDPNDYLSEELEQSLKDIVPNEILDRQRIFISEPQLSGLWEIAWGRLAPVILGSTEQDGQRADELFSAISAHCIDENRSGNFRRRDALELIERWRESALQLAFAPASHPFEQSATGIRVWMPAGEMSDEQRIALSIACQSKPSFDLHRAQLESKVQALIKADPREAKWALEMFDLNQIVFDSNVSGWAANLMYQDVMMIFLNLIDWDEPGEFVELTEAETIGGFLAALA